MKIQYQQFSNEPAITEWLERFYGVAAENLVSSTPPTEKGDSTVVCQYNKQDALPDDVKVMYTNELLIGGNVLCDGRFIQMKEVTEKHHIIKVVPPTPYHVLDNGWAVYLMSNSKMVRFQVESITPTDIIVQRNMRLPLCTYNRSNGKLKTPAPDVCNQLRIDDESEAQYQQDRRESTRQFRMTKIAQSLPKLSSDQIRELFHKMNEWGVWE